MKSATGLLGKKAPSENQQRQRSETEDNRRNIRLTDMPDEICNAMPKIAVCTFKTTELRELCADQPQSYARLEAEHNGLGNKFYDRSRTNEPGDERRRCR